MIGLLGTLATEGMKTFAEMQRIQAGVEEIALQQLSPEEMAQLEAQQSAAPQIPGMTEEQYIAAQQQAEMHQQSAAEAEHARRMAAFASPAATAPATPTVAPQVMTAPTAIVPVQPAPVAFNLSAAAPAPPDAVKRLPPVTRKKAREAIRVLVAALKGAPEAQWQAVITQHIMRTTQILEYIQAATIRAAMLEGGADDAFAARIIAQIDASGLVPPTFPRG